jgi:hypothetical protein
MAMGRVVDGPHADNEIDVTEATYAAQSIKLIRLTMPNIFSGNLMISVSSKWLTRHHLRQT